PELGRSSDGRGQPAGRHGQADQRHVQGHPSRHVPRRHCTVGWVAQRRGRGEQALQPASVGPGAGRQGQAGDRGWHRQGPLDRWGLARLWSRVRLSLQEATRARMPALARLTGIVKRYDDLVANDGVAFQVHAGEVHALLGENGAGKTTLMNILYGLTKPDEGQILLDGHEVHLTSPSDAIDRGISMVHQHFMLVPVLTVAENIVLGDETMTARYFLDRNEAHRRIVALCRAVVAQTRHR